MTAPRLRRTRSGISLSPRTVRTLGRFREPRAGAKFGAAAGRKRSSVNVEPRCTKYTKHHLFLIFLRDESSSPAYWRTLRNCKFVMHFYADVRQEPLIGPIFNTRIRIGN